MIIGYLDPWGIEKRLLWGSYRQHLVLGTPRTGFIETTPSCRKFRVSVTETKGWMVKGFGFSGSAIFGGPFLNLEP